MGSKECTESRLHQLIIPFLDHKAINQFRSHTPLTDWTYFPRTIEVSTEEFNISSQWIMLPNNLHPVFSMTIIINPHIKHHCQIFFSLSDVWFQKNTKETNVMENNFFAFVFSSESPRKKSNIIKINEFTNSKIYFFIFLSFSLLLLSSLFSFHCNFPQIFQTKDSLCLKNAQFYLF